MNQLAALLFIVLMIGSTGAFAFLNAFRSPEENKIEIPQSRVIDYEMSEQQIKYLLSQGYTVLKYSYSSGCLECGGILSRLEGYTQTSEGQIYLEEIMSNDVSSELEVTSLYGQKKLENPTQDEIQETLCEKLLNKPLWCVTSELGDLDIGEDLNVSEETNSSES